MNGPGKYDEWCTAIRAAEEAGTVVVIVLDARRGNGFAVQSPPQFVTRMPVLLREIAAQMEADIAAHSAKEPTEGASTDPLPDHQTQGITEPNTESVAVVGDQPLSETVQ